MAFIYRKCHKQLWHQTAKNSTRTVNRAQFVNDKKFCTQKPNLKCRKLLNNELHIKTSRPQRKIQSRPEKLTSTDGHCNGPFIRWSWDARGMSDKLLSGVVVNWISAMINSMLQNDKKRCMLSYTLHVISVAKSCITHLHMACRRCGLLTTNFNKCSTHVIIITICMTSCWLLAQNEKLNCNSLF